MSETRNVEWQVSGNDLFIRIDLSKRLGPSSSGKTTVVATTGGSLEVAAGVRLGLNVYTKDRK